MQGRFFYPTPGPSPKHQGGELRQVESRFCMGFAVYANARRNLPPIDMGDRGDRPLAANLTIFIPTTYLVLLRVGIGDRR